MSIQSFYRNKIDNTTKFLSKKEKLNFQVISWEAFDEETTDEDEEVEYKIYMFGVTDDNLSISVKIEGFTPYFFVKIPENLQENWSEYKTNEIFNFLKKKLYKFKDGLLKVNVVEKKDIDGFTMQKNFKFLKIVTKSEKVFKKCRYILCPTYTKTKPLILSISNLEINFEIYEANIDPFIRFAHVRDIKMAGWCEIDKSKIYEEDLSRCQLDISCKWNQIIGTNKKDISKILIASYDIECVSERAKKYQKNIFPDFELENDKISQIGTSFWIYGTNKYIHHICTLNSYDKKGVDNVENLIIDIFESEKELIKGWINLIRKIDPDYITGYNINGFDWKYIKERCNMLDIYLDLCRLSRLHDVPAKFVETELKIASGENNFKYMDCPGILNSDLMTIVKREQKLTSYKLNDVATIHIEDQKDDLSPLDIFNKAEGSSEDVALVCKYCSKDCYLVIRLLKKLKIVTNYIAMANVTSVPIIFIETRGQQIKVHSQILKKARQRNYLVPTLPYKDNTDVDEDEKFTGATVLDAEPGAHFEQISGLDFASLYPSIMISKNLSYETMIKNDKYANLENVKYEDIIWIENEGKENERTEKVRFIRSEQGKGILPEILEELWSERKQIKKEMKLIKQKIKEATAASDTKLLEELENDYAIADGNQLAMKLSMNSIYGFTGANYGRLPEKRIAAAVTATGRDMIKQCKNFVEKNYNCKVVYGDTDSIYVKFFTEYSGQEHMDEVFKLSEKAANELSGLFKKPVEMEFEKVMWPFILFSKKRYACVIWTNENKYDYIDYKGIQVVRRDNCPLIKQKSMKIFETILLERNIEKSVEMAREYSKNLLEGNYPIKDLVISKSLKGYGSYEFDKQVQCSNCGMRWYTIEGNKKKYKIPMNDKKSLLENINNFIKEEKYCHKCKKDTYFIKNKANIPHVALARKMYDRDPYNCPVAGERVPYVFKKTDNKRDLQFQKVEDPQYLIKNGLELDYEYYFEHQLKSALDTIFTPILKEELEKKLYDGIIEKKKRKILKE